MINFDFTYIYFRSNAVPMQERTVETCCMDERIFAAEVDLACVSEKLGITPDLQEDNCEVWCWQCSYCLDVSYTIYCENPEREEKDSIKKIEEIAHKCERCSDVYLKNKPMCHYCRAIVEQEEHLKKHEGK